MSGRIPSYAAGTLYRTGPSGYKVKTDKGNELAMSHWFDGFVKVHRFQLQPTSDSMKVTYNSRIACDDALEKMRKSGNFNEFSFGNKRDPCESFFKKVQTVFRTVTTQNANTETASSGNIGVTLSVNMPGNAVDAGESGPNLYTKTDAAVYQRLDPETLEPIGIAKQTALHPDLKGPLSAAHAKSDPITGDVFNFNLNFGVKAEYKVFRVNAKTGKTDILATINAPPAYLHSLFITEDHVVLCVWNSHIAKAGASILFNSNILDSIAPFNDKEPARWFVVDRKHGKGLLATYESPAFYCFHTVNAWTEQSKTEPGKIDVICDLSAYDNLDVIKKFYYENVMSTGPGVKLYQGPEGDICRPFLRRYRLPSIPSEPSSAIQKAEIDWSTPRAIGAELPTFNGKYVTKKHRYTYGIADRGKCSFVDGLVKFDAETQTAIHWERAHHSPGEPIFVANPSGADEDDGVLLSVVLDGDSGKSYLMCLNAKDMTELGRADVNGVVGFGFHGAHVPKKGMVLDL